MTDDITQAYADWLRAHQMLLDAEEQLRSLPRKANPELLDAAAARVQQLRVESDQLLAAAQAKMRGTIRPKTQ